MISPGPEFQCVVCAGSEPSAVAMCLGESPPPVPPAPPAPSSPSAAGSEPAFEGGICCLVEAGLSGLILGCELDVSYDVPGQNGCGFSVPIGGIHISPSFRNHLPPQLGHLTIGTGFCCSISFNPSNIDTCELECSAEAPGISYQEAGCSHTGATVWKAPCSALTGAFDGVALLESGGGNGPLPPTICSTQCPVNCLDLPPQIDPTTGAEIGTTLGTLFLPDTKCVSGLYGCCSYAGAFCKPWCYIELSGGGS